MGNKLETLFRASLNLEKDKLWFIKLQVFPGAMTDSPADFIVKSENYMNLVECKKVELSKGYKTFPFDRLSQENSLIYFSQKHKNNRSFVLIAFLEKYKRKSFYFLISIEKYLEFKAKVNKKSANLSDFQASFSSLECQKFLLLKDIF